MSVAFNHMISTANKISLSAGDYALKTVKIFQSSTAELTRTLTVDLKRGRNVLEITGLSSRIDTESPRIHGLGQDARVFDISCNTNLTAAPGPRMRKYTEALKKIALNLQSVKVERYIRQNEYDMLDNAVESLANGKPTELDDFMDGFVRRKRAAMQAVRECDERIVVLEREQWSMTDASRGEVAGRVNATILARRECNVVFQLTYLVSGVSWTPYYDLHATTSEGRPSPAISLLYCANITQNTGEDWSDTTLTLSTANSQALRDLSVPVLAPLKVSPQHPPPVAPVAPVVPAPQPAVAKGWPRTRYTPRLSTNPTFEFEDIDPDEEPADASGPPTTVDRSPLALFYYVDEPITLPSDGVAHKISIAELGFTADLKYVCVPRKNTSAFIEGNIKNTSEYELLAGPVSVFMDDGFITKTSLNLISVNETFDCVLGVDTALRVTYSQNSRTEHEAGRSFAEPTKTTTRTITTTATNGHTFDISNFVIRDTIPLGNEEANIKVMLLKPDGLAQTTDGDEVTVNLAGDVKEVKARWSKVENGKGGEKDGMYEWVCAVPAGKKIALEAEWAVKAPRDVEWEETVNKDGA